MADFSKIRDDNKDWTNCLFFKGNKSVLFQTTSENDDSIDKFIHLFDDYDATIKVGLTYNGVHYHVHRFYDGLIYGRADPNTKRTDGFCLYRVEREGKDALYSLITYDLPNVSARMIPLLAKTVDSFKDQVE